MAAYPGGMTALPPAKVEKDGKQWRVGTDADVGWIQRSTTIGLTIASAIPPVFAAFATVTVPDRDHGRSAHMRSLLRILSEESADTSWWLGYLDTGTDDVVFPAAPRVTLYGGWGYVLVQAGPEQAATWRQQAHSWRAPGPDLIFPADESWLVSWLWDDDWRCVGGPTEVIERLLMDPHLQARRVSVDDDATPPGHTAR